MAKKTTKTTTGDTTAPKAARMMHQDLFGVAAKAAPVSKPKGSGGGSGRDEISFGADLDRLAAFKVLIDALEGPAKQLQEQLRLKGYEVYADRAHAAGSHPSSFLATGDVATASVEMRRRGSNMPINDLEVKEELAKLGIPLQENVKVPERFVFNAELLQDEKIRNAISQAFGSHPALAPIADQLIQKQDKEFNWVTTEMTLEVAAQKLTEDDYARLVPYLSTLAIGKFHLNGAAIASKVKGEDSVITPEAKAIAIDMLQKMGVLPKKS